MMRRLAWVVAGAVALAGAGFTVATVADADSGSRYRVATVSVGDVAQAVSVSGTVDRVNRADVAFGTDGTLASLSVAVGDTVNAGQELGALDTTSLQAAVDKATADVDSAESNLSDAEDAVEEESSSEPSDDSSGLVQEVKNAQTASSAALKAASDAVTAQAAACADPASAACAAAGATTLTAQQAVQKAQDTLQAKLDALSAALSQSSSEESRPSTDSSASSVAEAQAAVDEAKVKLVEAEQALAGGTLTSPITGTVASVTGVAGDQVSASTAVVVVVGEGAAEVSATVAVEQLSKLSVGQEATVTPVGTSEKVTGSVTRVSTLPDPNAESVAYPVTITIDEPPATMAAGSSATASIVVATAEDVLTVPTSAVNRNTVTLLNADQTTTVTRVTVGAVGPTRTEITEGVSEGDEVVLANLDSPLPTSDQSNTQGGFMNGGPGGGPNGGGGGGPMMRTGPGN
jgi:HlyD family secretion protein